MKNFLNAKTIVLSIFVAIIGSALWEYLFRDLLNLCGRFLLTISTLGVQKYKDDIYINIASGLHEQVSLQILSLGMGVLVGFIFATALFPFKHKEKDDKKDSKIREWLKNHGSFIRAAFLTYALLVIGITMLSLAKIEYINKTIAYYNQLENIASPYLTDEQEEMFNSRFAQIKNKEDFVKIIDELNGIIRNEVKDFPKPPDFIF